MSKFFNTLLKKVLPKPKPTNTINSVKAIFNKDSAHKISSAKIPGIVDNSFKSATKSTENFLTTARKFNQKAFGEKPTESGISKGKNLSKDRE